jgi:hypothetical protein
MGPALSISMLGLSLLLATPPARLPILPGTTWAASYYHYHEDWTFVSVESVAIRSGQWGWSMPVDPKLIDADSLYLGDPEVVAYRLLGDHLTLDLHGDGGMDTLTWDGERFVSNWMYTYGHVVLSKGGNPDCRMHD